MQPKSFLRCLGQPALFSPSSELVRFRTKKHLALLVYLAVENRRVHRRDRLAEFLWPRAQTAEARHSLATALSILRPRLGPNALATTRDHVTLNVESLGLDLDRLTSKDILGSDSIGVLEVAAFLDGFDIPDAPEFALWKDRQRARLLPLIKEGLVVLIDRCRRTGQSRQVERWADRMLALDDLSEEGTKAKMEARAVAGDRLTALRVFEEWKRRLWDDLGASPSEELERMAARLRRGRWERTTINDIPVLPPEHGRERAFVGRAREYHILYELWEALKRGTSTHSIVLGDSGVGKTTLVERLTTVASLEGAAVATVQSYDLEQSIPFAALGGIIIQLLERPGASATSPEALSELAHTVPEVRRRFPSLLPAVESHGETARLRLTEAFHELLRAVAEEHPVILVVDDLHLTDEASLAVLHLGLRRLAGDRIMSIFTGRPSELSKSSQGAILQESVSRAGGKEILLAPLDLDSTGDLLAALLMSDDPKPTPSVQRSLIRASGGFPMVLELLVQDWRTNGDSSVTIALEAMTAEFVGGGGPMAAFARILSRLTGTLDPAPRTALSLASVLGHRLNDLSMYSVVDLGLGATMAALAHLAELRVLRDGANGLAFANELIRVQAYSAIPSSVRRALHGSVADRLLHSKHQEERASGLEIAWHCMRAGRAELAIPHLFDGAQDAIRRGAPQSAERALSSAMGSLRKTDLSRATVLLVEALQEQGRWRESLQMIETLEVGSTESSNQEAFALAALATNYLGTPLDEWLALLPTLKTIMETSPQASTRIRAAKAIAHATSNMRDRSLASEVLAVVDRIAITGLDADSRSHIGLARAILLFQAGDMEASFHDASVLLEELGRRGLANSQVAQLHLGLGAIRGRQGHYDEAAAHHERALRLATLLDNDTLIMSTCANLALCYGRLGRYDDQLQCASSCPQKALDEPVNFVDVHLAYSIAFSHAIEGRIDKMREAFEDCERRLGPHVSGSITQSWLLWKADTLAVAGFREEALRAAACAVKDYGMKLEYGGLTGVFARWTALTCFGTALQERATALLMTLNDCLSEYDALDQVEILSARMHCKCASAEEFENEVAPRLRLLPETALIPLRASGILPPSTTAASLNSPT